MICPQTKVECGCRSLVAGCLAAHMAEIERLVDVLQQSTRIFGRHGDEAAFEAMVTDRAALMAAIQKITRDLK